MIPPCGLFTFFLFFQLSVTEYAPGPGEKDLFFMLNLSAWLAKAAENLGYPQWSSELFVDFKSKGV